MIKTVITRECDICGSEMGIEDRYGLSAYLTEYITKIEIESPWVGKYGGESYTDICVECNNKILYFIGGLAT